MWVKAYVYIHEDEHAKKEMKMDGFRCNTTFIHECHHNTDQQLPHQYRHAWILNE